MAEVEFRTGVIRPIECFKEGWELIKDQYWLLFAISLVGVLIGGASMYILLGAMICGIFYCYFQKIDGKTLKFEDLFKGFSYFVPSLLLMLVVIIPTIVLMAIIYVPLIIAVAAGKNLNSDELLTIFLGGLAVDIVFTIIMVCFHTLLMFAFPLVVDRNLPALQAIKLSIRAVWANLSGVAGLFGVGFVINILGALACGIGAYFVIPIVISGNIVAYRKVFPSGQNPNQPPPPNAYKGAGSYN
jgi:hypothetical protein